MRYYNIVIKHPTTGATLKQWSSMNGGYTDPGAHLVEFEIYSSFFATPTGSVDSSIKVWGPSIQELFDANYNGASIDVYAGMSKGLPLANPAQQGALIKDGTIWQQYSNWIGTDMTIDFIVKALAPGNLSFHWKAGTPLAQAIAATLSAAYPKMKQQINISPNLKLAHDEYGYYDTMAEFAGMLQSITVNLFGVTYRGVQVTLRDGAISVTDGTTPQQPVQLAFTDLVGQPTWLEPQIVQVTTVMRGDIQAGQHIKLPQRTSAAPGQVFSPPQSLAQFRSKSAFEGSLFVQAVRHIGNSRDPDGRAWVSIFNCALDA